MEVAEQPERETGRSKMKMNLIIEQPGYRVNLKNLQVEQTFGEESPGFNISIVLGDSHPDVNQ